MDYAYALDICRDVYRQTYGLEGLGSKKHNNKEHKEVQLLNKEKNNNNNKPKGGRKF